jgi:hypothetical protein
MGIASLELKLSRVKLGAPDFLSDQESRRDDGCRGRAKGIGVCLESDAEFVESSIKILDATSLRSTWLCSSDCLTVSGCGDLWSSIQDR